MADNNLEIEKLNEALMMLQNSFDRFSQGLDSSSSGMDKNSKAVKDLIDIHKKQKQAIEEANEKLREYGRGLGLATKNFTSSVLDSSTSFKKYTSTIDALGNTVQIAAQGMGKLAGPIGLLITVITKLGGMALDLADNTLKAYDSLGDLGAVSGLSTKELRELGARAGYSSEALEKLLEPAKSLGIGLVSLGKNTTEGVKAFGQIASISEEQRKQFRNLGLSQEEVTKIQAKYVEQVAATGGTLNKPITQLKNESIKYVEQLQLLATLTGVSVEKQQEALDKALAQENFAAYIRELERKQAEATTEEERKTLQLEIEKRKALAADIVANESGARAIGKLQLLATDYGEVITEQSAGLAMTGELEGFRNVLKRTKDASVGVTEVVIQQRANSISTLKQFEKQFQGYTALGGSLGELQKTMGLSNDDFKNLSRNEKMLAELEGKSIEEQEKIIKKYADETKKTQQDQASTQDALLKARNEKLELEIKARTALEQALGNATESVIKAFERLVEVVKEATEWLEKWFGTDPAEKARKEAIEKEKEKLRREVIAAPTTAEDVNKQRRASGQPELSPEAAEAQAARETQQRMGRVRNYGRTAGVMIPTTQEGLAKEHGLKLRPTGGDIHKEGEGISPNLIDLAKFAQSNIKGFAHFTSFNDAFHQNRQSRHREGLALDFVLDKVPNKKEGEEIVSQLKAAGATFVLDEYNKPSSGSTGGHIHAEVLPKAALGGIFSGPTSGYPIEMHGTEMVTPLDANSILAKLAQTSATEIENQLQTQSNTSTEMVSVLIDKLNDMIDRLDNSNDIQSQLLTYARV